MADEKPGPSLGRRSFVASLGIGGAAGLIPVAAGADTAPNTMPPMPMPAPPASGATPHPGYAFFNVDEAAFIEAAVDTLIPADDVGPGGVDSGVAIFIDRQMAGAYGSGGGLYTQGPFAEGTPQQGYQLPLLPADLMRAGIADANAWSQQSRKKDFTALAPADRAAVITEIEAGKAQFPTVPSRAFFALLLQLTQEGYFADPIYGGNRDKSAWKMIGFPGVGGMYADQIEAYRNKPYPVDPKSIQDFG
jgi:gluconate 2-dehydrogenase gamma chain